MRKLIEKLLGDQNQKELKKIQPIVNQINALEPELEKLSDEDLQKKSLDLKKEASTKDGDELKKYLDKILPEAFALVREASKRTLGMRHFDVQLIGGIALHQGKIAEMKTGEGKTLVATLPLYLNALSGKGVHLVTPNDYLAKVGAQWNGSLYSFLGLSVSVIGQQMASWQYADKSVEVQEVQDDKSTNKKSKNKKQDTKLETPDTNQDWPNLKPTSRQEAYKADIVYGTNNEFGFDYLRDNMAMGLGGVAQRALYYAIVDEVDSILIDEARTPLIISAPASESADLYARFAQFVRTLKNEEDYEVNEKERFVKILEPGIKKMEKSLGVDNIYSDKTVAYVHHLEEALKAQALFRLDKDYVVKDGEVIIVDEFTGRLMPGRRYSEGLHQAIEAKEGVEVRQESQTLATITFQNLFRMYDKLAGMTGTATTEAEEFLRIYGLDVVAIPTHRPVARIDQEDVIYKTEDLKFKAIAEEVKNAVEHNQPVLIGTVSIAKSEQLSDYLRKVGIKHDILNAKNHEREAKIIEHAGEPGKVTVATNMAGRGVDIVLGGKKPNPEDPKSAFKAWEQSHQEVLEAGGLMVIGTERHETRRIDNQLRGRSGRQGDPGLSKFFVSLDDDLMRIFNGDRLKDLMNRLGLPDDEPIRHKLISNAIEQAQKKVESHNFDIRKHLVEYDDVMNQHRDIIYKKRRKILALEAKTDTWLHEEIEYLLHDEEQDTFKEKVEKVGLENFREIEKFVYLRTIDRLWVEHLGTMTHLREGIGLKGYAQKDPLVEYKDSAYGLFESLKDRIENQVVEMLLKVEIGQGSGATLAPANTTQNTNLVLSGADNSNAGGFENLPANFEAKNTEIAELSSPPSPTPPAKISDTRVNPSATSEVSLTVRGPGGKKETSTVSPASHSAPMLSVQKVGRNDPCPCGSGKKFKKCHGK